MSDEEIAQAKRDLDKKTYEQEFEATFVTYSGMVYYGFKRSENVKEFTFTQPQKIIHIAIDMNIDPMSAVCFVMEKNKVIIIDEIEMFGSNTGRAGERDIRKVPGHQDICLSGSKCKSHVSPVRAGRTDLSILANAGFIVKAPNRHMPVRDRINSVNSMLCNGQGERQILIHPKCKKLISCLERQIYKPGTSQPDKDGGMGSHERCTGIRYQLPVPDNETVQTTNQHNQPGQ